MNIFGVFVIICGIAISSGQPVETHIRHPSQTSASHQLHNNIVRTRLEHYPASQLYQTHVIDYPGSEYAAQHQQAQANYMRMLQQMQPQPNWVQTQVQPEYVQVQQPQQHHQQPHHQQQQQHHQQQQQHKQHQHQQHQHQQHQHQQHHQPAYVQVQQQQPNYVESQQDPNNVQSQPQPTFVHSKKFFKNQPTIDTRIEYQPVPEYQQTVQTVPTEPFTTTTTTTTTTTPEPIVIDEEEPAPLPVPAIRAPIRRVRPQHVKHVQPTKPVHQVTQFQPQGQDFADDFDIEQENVQVPHEETEEEHLLRAEQNKNAHYSFGTSIDDKINDHSIQRSETREGLALRGMYSYSDGYFKRTIHYQADENGYRVIKEEIEPIGNGEGPQYNPNGTADVTADLHNNHLSYSITAEDFVRDKEKNKKNKTVINEYEE